MHACFHKNCSDVVVHGGHGTSSSRCCILSRKCSCSCKWSFCKRWFWFKGTWTDSCQHARRNRTHLCRTRTRCSVREVYEQIGPLYFRRRAYRKKFSTFKRLANELRPCIRQAAGRKEVRIHLKDMPWMDVYHLMSDLLVQSVGSLGVLHTTWWLLTVWVIMKYSTAIGTLSTLLTNMIPDLPSNTQTITMHSRQLLKVSTKCQGPASSAARVQSMAYWFGYINRHQKTAWTMVVTMVSSTVLVGRRSMAWIVRQFAMRLDKFWTFQSYIQVLHLIVSHSRVCHCFRS